MNLKEYYKQLLNEGIPLSPAQHAERMREVRTAANVPMSSFTRKEMFEEDALERAHRLGQLQIHGTRIAEKVIETLADHIPGMYDEHMESQMSGNFGNFDPPNATKDAKRYIRIANMIASHPKGGINHAARYLHGASMYQLGLGTQSGHDDPFFHDGVYRTKRGDYVDRGGNELEGANIETKYDDHKGSIPTKRGMEQGSRALRIMSAARQNLRGRS
jgi:hypothetical protein